MALMLEEYTHVLRRAFFDVHNEVGLGRREEAYHEALKLWFKENHLPVVSKQPHRLTLRGVEAYSLFPDFVGWNALAVEIKAVPRKLGNSEWVQVRDYMKFRRESIGLLVNFGLDRVYVERIIHTPQETKLLEDWSYWKGRIEGKDRELGIALRDALRLIYREHTTGYGLETTTGLLVKSLSLNGFTVVTNPLAKATYHEHVVDESPIECLIVNGRFLVVFTALFDSNEFNISRGLSYMKTLRLNWGVAVNFGATAAEFQSLRLAA